MATAKGKRPPAKGAKKPAAKKTAKKGGARVPIGFCLLGLCVLLAFCMLTNSNAAVVLALRRLVNGVFGVLGMLWLVPVAWLGVRLILGTRCLLRASVSVYATLLVFCLATTIHVFHIDTVLLSLRGKGYAEIYWNFISNSYLDSLNVPLGGGLIGALLSYPLRMALDVVGAVLVLFFAMGALLLSGIRAAFPGAGGNVSGWFARLRAETEENRAARRAERERRARQAETLTPLPKELLEDDEPAPAPKKQAKATRSAPMSPPRKPAAVAAEAYAAPAAPPKLFIEDILPEPEPRVASEEAFTEYDAERIKQKKRPSLREQKEELPDFLSKRREKFDAYYGAFQQGKQEASEAEPDSEPEGDDLPPWEPLPDAEAPETPAPAPLRRRRGRFESPLDKLPERREEDKIDRPDWKPPEEKVTPEEAPETYRQPPFSLLTRSEADRRRDTRDEDERGAKKLIDTLASFGVTAKVLKVVHGPAITRYELQPAPGVKVSKIVGLVDDIALNMAALGVRIEAPIPGVAAIGIEIANERVETVYLRDVLESEESMREPSRLAIALGKDIAGKRIIADLANMPHLLIGGTTGSGKSVCINTIITSIIYRTTPEEVRLILIDPKVVELSVYNGIPHLLIPVVTDAKKASSALCWAVMEMNERYKRFADAGVRELTGYNRQRPKGEPLMPQIIIVIDELADLMMVAPGEVEEAICRLAQLARACGIHLVIATQRPSVSVITGNIKGNINSRIAFAVASQVDARTIFDVSGAEKLLGKGDMLFAKKAGGKPLRVQGCFISDQEVARVVEYVKERHDSDYAQAVIDALESEETELPPDEDNNESDFDDLFVQAVEMCLDSGQASVSMLQRRLRVGYARAGRLIDEMARRGIIAQAEGTKPRQILITHEDFRIMFKK